MDSHRLKQSKVALCADMTSLRANTCIAHLWQLGYAGRLAELNKSFLAKNNA